MCSGPSQSGNLKRGQSWLASAYQEESAVQGSKNQREQMISGLVAHGVLAGGQKKCDPAYQSLSAHFRSHYCKKFGKCNGCSNADAIEKENHSLKKELFRESLKPMVRLSGNIHGNEAVGREIGLAFARFGPIDFFSSWGLMCICSRKNSRSMKALWRHLILGYGVDSRLTQIVDSKSQLLN